MEELLCLRQLNIDWRPELFHLKTLGPKALIGLYFDIDRLKMSDQFISWSWKLTLRLLLQTCLLWPRENKVLKTYCERYVELCTSLDLLVGSMKNPKTHAQFQTHATKVFSLKVYKLKLRAKRTLFKGASIKDVRGRGRGVSQKWTK